MGLETENIRVDDLILNGITADPATPPDGCMWYRSDLNEFRRRENGVNKTIKNLTDAEIKTQYEANANTNAFTDADSSKLGGIATGATANSSDSFLLDRANHTGTQLAGTISNFAATVRSTILTGISFATATAVLSTDTILVAIGKLQAQINALSGTTWQPPQGDLGLGATSGVSIFRANGGGLEYSFDGSSDDELSANILLRNNGIAYDGSEIKVTIYYQLSINADPTDDANILLDLQFVNIGDNVDAVPTTTNENITLDGKLSGQVYGFTFVTTFSGTAGDKLLMFSSMINATGAGQGSYTGSVYQLGYEIEKV